MKKKIAVVMLTLMLSPLAFANAMEGGSNSASSKAEWKEKRKEAVEEKCKNMESRIEAQMNKYENGNISVEDVHKNLKERIQNMVTRLENNGIDAGKLKEDLAELEQKIAQTAANYDTFIAGLEATKTYACGESQGQFRTKLQEAKKLMVSVRESRKETRSYIVNTIIPDIKALREQLKAEIQEKNKVNAD